ncbi:MAG: ribonuclease P protein component [Patescibacteria group bacterium]
MLVAKYRLKRRTDFQKIYRYGHYFFTPFLVLRTLPNKEGNPRFAEVISAKVAPKAVTRNRFKRQLSEIIRHHLGNFAPGLDYVFAAKKPVFGLAYGGLEKNLISLIKKAKLWRD